VRERDTTITGPRGRTAERDLKSTITPGGIDRQTIIRRPGGATFERDVHINRSPGFAGGAGGFRPVPTGRNVFIERNVFVNNRPGWGWSPLANFGLGAALGAGTGLLLGSALASPPPPPPIYVAPAPVVVAAPGTVVRPPVVIQPAAPATVVVDQVALAVNRLRSNHDHSRRDACYTLGRLGDPRGVPALIDRLKNDRATEVKVAAATALGQIGEPGSAIVLERATIYDKKQEVRDAAATALAMIHQRTAASASASVAPAGGNVSLSGPATSSAVPPLEEPPLNVPPPPKPGIMPTRNPY
jgi:hypothetical protein